MENENFKNGIEDIKNIKMTALEKEAMLHSVLNSPIPTIEPIKSPYQKIFRIQKSHLFYYGTVLCLIVVLISGGKIAFNNLQNKNYNNGNTFAVLPKQENNVISGDQNIQNSNLDNVDTFAKINDNKTNTPLENTNKPTAKTTKKPTESNTSEGQIAYVPNPPTGATMSPSAGAMMGTNNQNQEQYIEIAYPAFSKYFEQLAKEVGGVLDYKINKIDFVALKETAQEPYLSWFIPNETKNAFIVTVNFSVKVTEEGKTGYWMALGATPNGPDWLTNSLIVTIEKNTDGYYVKRAGTGP